jgi:hypothetical protein
MLSSTPFPCFELKQFLQSFKASVSKELSVVSVLSSKILSKLSTSLQTAPSESVGYWMSIIGKG